MSKLTNSNKPKRKRQVIDYRTDSIEAYKSFKEVYPEVDISYTKWRTVICTHNDLLSKYILETGDRFKLRNLGTFAVSKKKIRKFVDKGDGVSHISLPVDWKRSKELGKKVYLFNNHSDGYRYSFMWFRTDARFSSCKTWYFKAVRSVSRALAAYIFTGADQQEKYKEWKYNPRKPED